MIQEQGYERRGVGGGNVEGEEGVGVGMRYRVRRQGETTAREL